MEGVAFSRIAMAPSGGASLSRVAGWPPQLECAEASSGIYVCKPVDGALTPGRQLYAIEGLRDGDEIGDETDGASLDAVDELVGRNEPPR